MRVQNDLDLDSDRTLGDTGTSEERWTDGRPKVREPTALLDPVFNFRCQTTTERKQTLAAG